MKVFVNKTCCTNNNLSNILHFISKWVITSPLDGNITPFKLLCVCVCVCGVVWCGVVWCGVVCVCVCVFLCVSLFTTPGTVACQAHLSIEFSRQEYWSRLPFPSLGDLPDPGIESMSHVSCIGRWVLYQLSHQGSPIYVTTTPKRIFKFSKNVHVHLFTFSHSSKHLLGTFKLWWMLKIRGKTRQLTVAQRTRWGTGSFFGICGDVRRELQVEV